MNKSLLYLYFLSVFFLSFVQKAAAGHEEQQFDVCVYGETASGITSAIQAARMGKKVVLLSTTNHLGGVMTSGLTATDMNRYKTVGGLSREIFQKIYAYYTNPKNWKNQQRDEFFEMSKKRTYTGKNDSLKMQWVYESHVLERIYKDMLLEAGVKVVYNQKLNLDKGVLRNGSRIEKITMVSKEEYHAKMFIDATYEGDLMAKSGVSYFVGREANSQYKETKNGVHISKKILQIDPYIKEGDPSSGTLPFIEPKSKLVQGAADKKVQAYTYRVTLTDDAKNRVSVAKPKEYNPLWYEYILRKLKKYVEPILTNAITITPMPNRKTDTNHLDFVGASFDWAEAGYAKREELAEMHKNYALGLLWFLGNDKRVPKTVRKEMKKWGLPKDEFVDNNHFPHQIYVREARRMVSDFVMTENNCKPRNRVNAPNSIGLGTYAFDSHYVTFVMDEDSVRVDGGFFGVASIYPINYYSIVPKVGECANLLVPICLSASHVAYSSIRMEPVYMVLGQSAGTAAALSIDNKTSVQDLPYDILKKRLEQDHQILE
jgi:hypothetical protein